MNQHKAGKRTGVKRSRQPTVRQAAAADLAVSLPGSRIGMEFGGGSLVIDGKVFAFIGKDDRVVMKLPVERIDALLSKTDAERLTMGKRTMREWVVVSSRSSTATLRLLSEALAFVQSLPATNTKKAAVKKDPK